MTTTHKNKIKNKNEIIIIRLCLWAMIPVNRINTTIRLDLFSVQNSGQQSYIMFLYVY